ncbi:MAG: OsmC family peroxiredoxin [Candidatus Thorarchaeota archaeon]|nr:OsmC family peroxiredoxin [Candidatus Thorarchaeota archaeon]
MSRLTEDVHEYKVTVDWTEGTSGQFNVDGKPGFAIATPPEFEGPEGVVSPEDLFVGAAASCLLTTFVTFTKKMRFDFESFTCEGHGTLERMEKGFQFTRIVLKTRVVVNSEELRHQAERALELAGKYCLVTNSMKCQTEHENTVIVKETR